MNKDIVFFGIQWSWKGTQAKIFLNEFTAYKYIEPGQIFRALSSNDNAISSYMKDTMAQWKMLADTLAFDLFNMCFHLIDDWEYMLTDGFPRTMAQLHYFIAKECEHKRDFIWVYFDISREKAVERILNRAKEQNRADDLDMNVINKRLDTFEKETMPVIQYFDSIWKLLTVWADDSVENIYKSMIEWLNK